MRRLLLAVFAVALAAAGAACGSDLQAPPTTSSMADSADQVFFGVEHHMSQQGIRRATMDADTAYIFEEGVRLELRNVRLTFFTTEGVRDAVLTSREGTYNTRTGQMEARGDVVLVGEDGRRLMSEQLRYDQRADQIASDSAFVSIENDRRLEGIGFRANSDLSRWQCLEACRAGGTVTLPHTTGAEGAPQPESPDTTSART